MTGLPERDVASTFPAGSSTASSSSEQEPDQTKPSKASSWASIFSTPFSISDVYSSLSPTETKERRARAHGWTSSVRRAITSVSMRRLHERILGIGKTDVTSSGSEIWFLGACYRVSSGESSSESVHDEGLSGFLNDFSSRIWITYRKGFDPVDDLRLTSDVNWGCMIRSSQMLVAQALLFHHLGRNWRRPQQTPYDPEYIELLHLFGDSIASAFPSTICFKLERDTAWPPVPGSGPMPSLPMAVYVVSGDEDGERGGAPVLCVDIASRLCSELSMGEANWAPILLLVPLVLGLDKVNPRYIPLLWETFTFPQSLGVVGGKPGASTYIVGVQDDKALYLDPHLVQPVVDIKRGDLEADTSSYHCSTVRQLPLDQLDPSLAIGFYCRDRGDFEDFCARAIDLAEKSNGAPLFTVAAFLEPSSRTAAEAAVNGETSSESGHPEDDWQLL
ncbi:unnamed protein product [Spirodela intermedia]|uniref:Cysteine protease n=1 Tax=Spirodela intermedia TaxID=51605 RepID=A0A7I8JAW1_SPIIN|nr:unnamed protein product [Spirodela intermedia]CAA6666592.1 unnamed protein product [Spirodela intermedia]